MFRIPTIRLHFWSIWVTLALSFPSNKAFGGIMANIGLQMKTHAFAPVAEENTPNYYGIGPYLAFGYSLGKVWDFALFASYTPSQLETPAVGANDAQFSFYGLETGFRMGEAVFLGLEAGQVTYHLISQKQEDEILGKWQGYGGEVILGGLAKVSRNSGFQITLSLGSANMEEVKALEPVKRRVDWVGLTVSYVYIGLDSLRIDNIFLRDWLSF